MPFHDAVIEVVPDARELLARAPSDADEFVVADAKGMAAFIDVPPAPVQFGAYADRFRPASVRISEQSRASVVITLAPVPPLTR